jgi:serine/threonine protein kinase
MLAQRMQSKGTTEFNGPAKDEQQMLDPLLPVNDGPPDACRLDIDIEGNCQHIDMDAVERFECIGHGSCGQVFRARWNGLIVALKFVRLTPKQDSGSNDPASEEEVDEEEEADAHVNLMRRFMREVGILSRVHHPNVVSYIGSTSFFDITANMLRGAILMELVDGGTTLETAIQQLASSGHHVSTFNTANGTDSTHADAKRLTANVLSLGSQMACGLAYLHSKGIIHR